ncbi:MAG: amino acid adenylation domain-containing protein [Bryobacteraceae bacterium]|nr:amino acid adenylation domain-containing protein [Bryobacteraceae bacterium]
MTGQGATSTAMLSFGQERLWFLSQLEPNSPAYNVPQAFHLAGALDVEALRKALEDVVARHEALRATFREFEGRPVQIIHRDARLPFEVLDWRAKKLATDDVRVREYLAREAYRPFDLERDRPIRASLLRLSDEEHVLLLCIHHIASDGWSGRILAREIDSLYAAHCGAPAADLPAAGSYLEYAKRQREWFESPAFEEQLSYWKRQLSGLPSALEIPADFLLPAQPDHRGDVVSRDLAPELCQTLGAVASGESGTLFMLLLAALELHLGRLTGQDDFAVGAPIAGRAGRKTENVIGFFVNTLVMRASLSPGISFRDLLRRVRQTALDAYDHQEMPFERLVEELGVERSLSRNPLFEVMLNFAGFSEQPHRLPGLTVTRWDLPESHSKFAMTLYLWRKQGGLNLRLTYRRAQFTAARMEEFLRQYAFLLEQIAADPDRAIEAYSLVTPEARRLLPDPQTELPAPVYEPVTGLFSRVAERFPDRSAVSQGGRSWTYSVLHRRALLVARALLERGLRTGDVVAVTGPPSFGFIAGLLGALLGGGVILPVAVDLPPRRKETLLREGAARWLVIAGVDPAPPAASGLPAIRIDAGEGTPADPSPEPGSAELPSIAPDAPAYIFFTSGTTGAPKGVLGCHKGLSHFLAWQRETFAVDEADRVAALTNPSFDVTLRDTFLPLTCGATLCLPAGDDAAPDHVLAFLTRERVTILHCVPTLARIWLDSAHDDIAPGALRWVLFAGEPLTGELTRLWRARLPPHARLVNLYGPTETTLVKTCYVLPDDEPTDLLPAGRPLPQTQVLVMAGRERLCGIGEIGEVAIRTPFRTLGYVNAPEDNRNRFVANPFRRDPDDLLYWTGDRGRYLPDGSLTVAGRVDDQVKIRGVRIEPAEVSAVLAGHGSVKACFVNPVNDEQGQTRLAAYVALNQPCAQSELASFLAARLPLALVPDHFVFMDRLPVNTNGKVDRKSLPAPAVVPVSDRAERAAPQTPLERQLAAIWSEVLHIDGVGLNDSFFHVGGNSLRAVQIVSRIRREWNVALPLRRLFETPTVAELARAVDEALRERNQIDELLAEVEGLSQLPS